MARLSKVVTRSEFECLMREVLDMTDQCNRAQLMELADRLHERRRALPLGHLKDDIDFAIH